MANADVIYAIAVQGAQEAVTAFNSVGNAAKTGPKDATPAWSKFSGALDHASDSAKKVARDMDATGNKVAESSLKAIDNITGLASAMAMGPFSLVGAIGLVAGGWAIYNSYASSGAEINRKAKESVDALMTSTRALAEAQIGLNEADEKQLKHREDVTALMIESNAVFLQGMNLNLMGFRMAAAEQKRHLNDFDLSDPMGAKRAAEYMQTSETLKGLEAQFTAAVGEQERLRNDLRDLQGRRAIAIAERIENERKDIATKGARDEAKAFADGEREFYRVMDARARAYEKDKEAKARADKEAGDILEEAHRIIAQDDAENAKKVADALEKQRAAAERLRLEREKLNDEIRKTLLLGAGEQAFSQSYSAGMFVISNATSFASSQLKEFGNINRDNWRDTLAMTKDKQAAFVAEAQAALFNMGVQAGVKSFFEQAEALKETALMFGSLAMNDPKGVAAHGASAAAHAVAAGAYSLIGTGAVGGSLALGAARGNGGLVSSGTGGGGGNTASATTPSGPGPGSSSGGGDGGGGGTHITFVYEAGSINAADERATARTVANGVGAARGSWFERRRMERRA